jgi:hypothetical protein
MNQLHYTAKNKSAQQGGFFIAKKLTYRASIAGFHNPTKHKDLTPDEFLQLYIKRLRSQSKKKDGWMRVRLADWIEANYANQIIFVSKLFPLTLKTGRQHK